MTDLNVIASEARQSMALFRHCERSAAIQDFVDCHVATLLAMTELWPSLVPSQ
jgi:hypothetical protein